jgi:flotillin
VLDISPVVVGIVGVLVALGIVALIIVKRYRVANPDEAIIVTGRKGKTTVDSTGASLTDLTGQKVIAGGGIFVLPFVQRSFTLSLRSRRLTINTTAQTSNGITIDARAVAVVKVGGTEEMIRAAAQRFLSQQDEIETSTQEVLSGSLRGIIGTLTVESIIQDRAALASAVLSAAEDALTKQGLVVDTLQIQEISDTQDYIKNLGRPEAANVRQRAEIADIEATRNSESSKIDVQRILLDKNRDLRLREAAIQSETDKAQAEAQAARPLEDAIQQQKIISQREITAEKEAALTERQLDASVRKVADAEAYRIKTLADGNASARVSEAQGKATADIASADADRQKRELYATALEREGQAQRINRIANAEALAQEGKSEAEAIKAKGEAEAASIEARAHALATESAAVLAQDALHILPQMAKELASAYGNIDNLTVISSDGANKLSTDVVGNITTLQQTMKDATGIDIAGILNSAVSGNAAGHALGEATVKVPERPAKIS